MAVGIPVLAADTRTHQLYFDDNQVEYFKAENVDDLARRLVRLIENPARREELRAAGLKFIQRNNWEVKKHEYLDLVNRFSDAAAPEYRPGPTFTSGLITTLHLGISYLNCAVSRHHCSTGTKCTGRPSGTKTECRSPPKDQSSPLRVGARVLSPVHIICACDPGRAAPAREAQSRRIRVAGRLCDRRS